MNSTEYLDGPTRLHSLNIARILLALERSRSMASVVAETIDLITQKCPPRLQKVNIEDLVIGIFYRSEVILRPCRGRCHSHR